VRTVRAPAPFVGPEVLREALASQVPARPTLSDEIDHFEARLTARGEEALSRSHLVGAYLARFKAYGARADLEAAARHLDALTSSGLSDREASAARSALHLARHEFKGALTDARAASEGAPWSDAVNAYRLFDALWAAGEFERARDVLERPLDTTAVAFLSREARVFDRLGGVTQARDVFRGIVERVEAYAEPASVRGWALVEAGNFELHSGDPAAAVRRYRAALRVLPGSPAALEGLANVAYGVDRDPVVAAQLYRKALEHGAHLDLMPLLATVERERGEVGAAVRIEAAFKAEVLGDALNERWFRRPLALMLAGDAGTVCRAVALARADLEERRDPGALATLAWALYGAGDLRAAAALASEATRVGAAEPAVAYQAGVIALAQGDRRGGRNLLRAALEGEAELATAEVKHARALLARAPQPRPARRDCGGAPEDGAGA
jgi:tetratricopeptide (TPR) repeat protein